MHRILWKRTPLPARYPWLKPWVGTFALPLWASRRAHASDSSLSAPSNSAEGPSSPGGAKEINICVHSAVESKTTRFKAPVGITLMEAIRDIAKLEIEAACDGCCACSTCHVIFTVEAYEKLPEPPTEEEMDMLDLAPAATKSSRLSCQVRLTEEMDGIEVTIPDEL